MEENSPVNKAECLLLYLPGNQICSTGEERYSQHLDLELVTGEEVFGNVQELIADTDNN